MRVTGVGGGHGLAATLRAARLYAQEVTAVVTVADDGGSSGRLTREMSIPPPGDIRNCLVALAGRDDLAAVFQHRFSSGELTGHTVGNLIIAALADKLGDFGAAVAEAAAMLDARGAVFPATTRLVTLGALVEGQVVRGQVAVAQAARRIQAVYLDPVDPPAHPDAVRAIAGADQIVMGPGSLFTSLIATLLVPGLKEALRRSAATKVFVCNSRIQKGETQGFDALAHVEALEAHLGAGCVDVVVAQEPVLPIDGVQVHGDKFAAAGVALVRADVVSPNGTHDPRRLAEVLERLG